MKKEKAWVIPGSIHTKLRTTLPNRNPTVPLYIILQISQGYCFGSFIPYFSSARFLKTKRTFHPMFVPLCNAPRAHELLEAQWQWPLVQSSQMLRVSCWACRAVPGQLLVPLTALQLASRILVFLLQHVVNFSKQIEALQAAYCLNISSSFAPHKYRCSLSVEKIEKSAGVIFCPS